jgi:hypothetical protein
VPVDGEKHARRDWLAPALIGGRLDQELRRLYGWLEGRRPDARGECRHQSSMEGVATGFKLIGPNPANYRDWVLEGFFQMTDAATGGRTQASRMFNRGRRFFISVKDLLKTGKAVEFSYEFYVERPAVSGGLRKRVQIASLLALETSVSEWCLAHGIFPWASI